MSYVRVIIMICMAKKPGKVEKPAGRARDRGETILMTVEFDAALYGAMMEFVNGHRPKTTKRATLEWAMEEFLTKRGKWPAREE